jgi:hypothetical protein
VEQVAHIQGLDAVPTSQKDRIIGQLTQAQYENKHNLESLIDSTTCKSKVKIATFRPLFFSMRLQSQPQPSAGLSYDVLLAYNLPLV